LQKLLKWIWFKNVQFFKFLWVLLKSFWTKKGIISFIIAFMTVEGWAIVFMILGLITKNYKLLGIGSGVTLMWAGPFTPMWMIIAALAFCLQKFILRDPEALTWVEIKEIFKKDKSSNEEDFI